MDILIHPRLLRGDVTVIPSKSQAHRYLICAAFAQHPTQLICPETNRDMEATADCLRALGTRITRTDSGYFVEPVETVPEKALLPCGESGSTLRFLLPVAGALGVDATFLLEGRLPQRPLSPLWEEMERMGCALSRPTEHTLRCTGKLRPGEYTVDGSVSSQFISGLLFALPLISGKSRLTVTGNVESKPYIRMTEEALALFRDPAVRRVTVEGDWSNGAFWVTANALGSDLFIHGLDPDSPQGDRAVVPLLAQMAQGTPTVSCADIPDLVPVLAVAAACMRGAVFTDIRRLRLKESDRVASTVAILEALGGRAWATEDSLTVSPARLTGGTVDTCNDHRIAMAAAIAATVCTAPVTILGAECVEKSYPRFWEEYKHLGGNYELNLR